MTPQQEAAIRARHVPRPCFDGRHHDGDCGGCDDPWPCDAATLLAALDEARAQFYSMVQTANAAARQRNASLADADRLAAALRRARKAMDSVIVDGRNLSTVDYTGSMVAADDAIAAHEARREGA